MDTKGPDPSVHKLQISVCVSLGNRGRDCKIDISHTSREVAVLTRCLRLHNCNLCKFFCRVITKLIHSIVIIIIIITIIIIIIILCHCSPYFCNSNIVFLIKGLSKRFEVNG